MPREDAITVEGTLVKVLRNGRFLAELVNGHRLVAHPTRKSREKLAGLGLCDRVRLELSPFDMSKGRMVDRI